MTCNVFNGTLNLTQSSLNVLGPNRILFSADSNFGTFRFLHSKQSNNGSREQSESDFHSDVALII